MHPIYLIVGVPGVGKSWVCSQLSEKFSHVPHDEYKETEYPKALRAKMSAFRPVLGEIPFGLSKIHNEIARFGCQVIPVFIVEDEKTLRGRYLARTGNPILQGHLTRQKTYMQRAKELGSFVGTSHEVLKYLQELPL